MRTGFRHIAQTVAEQIRSGRYKNGQRLPRRVDFAKQFRASRVTIDRSIQHLTTQGLVVSKRGSGTYVSIGNERRYKIAFLGLPPDCERIAPPDHCQIEIIDYQRLEQPSQRAKLLDFEGLIWHWPDTWALPWIEEFQGRLPQLLLNREVASHNYVSTDHAGAIFTITSQRLQALPDAVPIFLQKASSAHSIVLGLREKGFVRACREAGRFYEILPLPSDFDQRIERLQQCGGEYPQRCLLIVSDSISPTGVVIHWVRTTGRQWKRDIYYSDFDDNLHRDTWGITVTSFLQNYSQLAALAIENLVALIEKQTESVAKLVPPRFIEGDT